MQEKISFTPPPLPQSLSGKSPETSQMLFSRVMDYLETSSQQESLQVVLNFVKKLQHTLIQQTQEASILKGKSKLATFDEAWKNTFQKFQNNKKLIPVFRQFVSNFEKKDYPSAIKDLNKFTSLHLENEEEFSLTAESQDILNEAFDPLLEGGDPQEGLSTLLLKGFIGNLPMTQKGSFAQLKAFLFSKLEQQATSIPPTFFSQSAKNLLQQLKGKGGDKVLEDLLNQKEELQEKILPLLSKAPMKVLLPGMIAAQKALEEKATTQELYKDYGETIRNLSAGKSRKEAAEGQLGNEIDTLQELIQYLEQYDPNDPQLKQYASMLTRISKDFPNLSTSDLTNLTQVFEGIFTLSSKIPKSLQAAFLKKMEKMLQEMENTNRGFISSYQNLIAQIKAKLSILDGVEGDISQILALLKEIAAGKQLSVTDMQKLSTALSDLLQNMNNLTPEEQQEVGKLFNELSKLAPNSNIMNLTDQLGAIIIENWTEEYCNSHPNATATGLKNWIQSQLAALGQNPNLSTFMKSILNYMNSATQAATFPQGFANVSGNAITPNAQFWTTLQNVFSFSSSSAQEAENGVLTVSTYFEQDYINLESQQYGLQNTIQALKKLDTLYGDAVSAIINKQLMGGSLPDDFANAILNHYMKGQEAYLEELAELLYYFNFGASMDNQLLNDIMGWSNSANNYNFSQWYNSTAGKETQSQVKNQITQEENQANGDLNEAEKLEADLKAQLAEIEKEEQSGKISPSRAKVLESQVNSELSNVGLAIGNLTKLIADLKNAYDNVSSNGTLPQSIITQLQTDENLVVKGDTTQNGAGGLQTIYQDLTNDETQWSSQSQQQQIMLQMHMTEIQQEWTVVSTALQLLNQMYMTVAQGIYK